ncbi:MAG TPA: T9SS type B sorting domain-containing protein, partial [Pricia sp.]|nr:T9SS type B sorting domain-containing protein [Pricia sp.]
GGVSGVTVTYHETLANAQNDVLDIASPTAFANTVYEQQTIYARVEAPGVDCFVIVEVVLQVVDSPQPVLSQNLPDLMGCDENGDGQYQFDLTLMEDDIEANEANPADFTLEYFADPTDIPDNPIGVPSAHVSGSGTIYVVVTGPNGCTKQTSFQIVVNPLPSITTPQPLELCDVNNPGDEQEVFDLTNATLDIAMGDPSIDVSYYQTEQEALAGTNPVPNPTSYTNEVNNETIYIRAEDTDTGCVSVQGYTLTLIVNPLPSPEIPAEPVAVCDADNDGFAEFDLAAQIPIIQNGELGVTISFHYTQAEANSGANPIDTSVPFGLNSINNQILYVRAENDITGCYTTGVLELEVVPTPVIDSLVDLYECDDDTPNGLRVFDLTENTLNILGGQSLNDVDITYHTSQADAESGANAIVVPSSYTNTSNGQYIYVRIEHTETGCFDTFDFTDDNSFQLFVEPLPIVNNPMPLMVCDDDYGKDPVEQAIFDLTVKEGEVTGQAFPPNDYGFAYYANQQDFQDGIRISEPAAYENVENPQTIYITVVNEDTQNRCEDYTTLTIIVQPLPSPSETDQEVLRLEQCDDDNDGVAALAFDLRQSGNLIAGGENVNLSYYKTEQAAKEGETTSAEYIVTPDGYTNEPSYNTINGQGMEVQVIYVRVESGVAGNECYVIAQFEIRVIPAPVLNDIDPFGYTLCEDGSSGSAALFTEDIARNLYDASVITPDPSVIVPLLDQTENTDLELGNYTIHYYSDQATPPTPFVSGTTVSTDDIIYVQVEYDETGCTSLIGEIIITVEPRPVIPGTDLIREVCSDEPGGTTATIDLTQFDVDVNPGAPADTEVVYYENMDAYNNGNAPIDTPVVYTTVENPQEIIGVVRDVNTLCESLDYSTILIEVNSSPMVDLSMYDGMIICRDLDLFTPTIGGDYQPIELETGLSETDYTFEWSLDGTVLAENGPNLLVTQAGTYTVTVTDISSSVNTSCTTTSSATILESNPPEFMVEVLTESFSEEHTITIGNVTGAGDYEFSVDQGPWMELGEDGTLTFTGISAGTHTVYGRDKNGCGTTAIDASIIDYPKFFTPNADGYNDTWNIIGIDGQPNAGIYIFDRYGKLLKQLSPVGPGWDGTYNGRPMPSSDYWFRVEYIEPKPDTPATFKAHFTLKR